MVLRVLRLTFVVGSIANVCVFVFAILVASKRWKHFFYEDVRHFSVCGCCGNTRFGAFYILLLPMTAGVFLFADVERLSICFCEVCKVNCYTKRMFSKKVK